MYSSATGPVQLIHHRLEPLQLGLRQPFSLYPSQRFVIMIEDRPTNPLNYSIQERRYRPSFLMEWMSRTLWASPLTHHSNIIIFLRCSAFVQTVLLTAFLEGLEVIFVSSQYTYLKGPERKCLQVCGPLNFERSTYLLYVTEAMDIKVMNGFGCVPIALFMNTNTLNLM